MHLFVAFISICEQASAHFNHTFTFLTHDKNKVYIIYILVTRYKYDQINSVVAFAYLLPLRMENIMIGTLMLQLRTKRWANPNCVKLGQPGWRRRAKPHMTCEL
jgi:hypothetical protein